MVRFHQRDEVDAGIGVVPFARRDLRQQRQSALIVGALRRRGTAAIGRFFGAGDERQRQVAQGLRLVGIELHDLAVEPERARLVAVTAL